MAKRGHFPDIASLPARGRGKAVEKRRIADKLFLTGPTQSGAHHTVTAAARRSPAIHPENGARRHFFDQTWLATLKKHGSKYGYARYADLIIKGQGLNQEQVCQAVIDGLP